MKIFGNWTEIVSLVFKKTSKDITLIPKDTPSGASSSVTFPSTVSGELVEIDITQTLTNKTIGDSADNTKALAFDLAGATTAKTTTLDLNHTDNRTLTLPDATDTLMGKATTDILTNKTFDADGTGNSITNIENADIKALAAITRSKLASGTNDHVIINSGAGAFSSEAQLAITRGGTAGSTATAGFDNLSPVTTKGDIIVRDASNNIREPIGADNTVLTADSAQTSGVRWGVAGSGDVSAASNLGTDNILVRSDGILKGVQSTGILLSDSDQMGIGTSTVGSHKLVVESTGASSTGVVSINATASSTFVWASSTLAPNLTANQNVVSFMGQAESASNAGYMGFNFAGAGSTSNFLTFGLFGNDNILNITAAGRIGIGTTTPGTKFHIRDTAAATATIQTTTGNADIDLNTGDADAFIKFSEASAGKFITGYDKSAGTYNINNGSSFGTAFSMNSSGDMGMGTGTFGGHRLVIEDPGTSNVAPLSVNSTGSALFTWVSSLIAPNLTAGQNVVSFIGQAEGVKNAGYLGFNYTSSGSNSNFLTLGLFGQDNVLNIDGSGDVGIGTTTPAHKLDVVGTAGLSTGTLWTNTSDARLKDIQGAYEYGLQELNQLNIVRFKYKVDNPLGLPSDINRVGLIAQEVAAIIPESVSLRKDKRGTGDYLEFNADPVLWATIKAVQELSTKVANLEAIINA